MFPQVRTRSERQQETPRTPPALSLAVLCVGSEQQAWEKWKCHRPEARVPRQQVGRICDQLISAAEISGTARNFSWHSQPATFTPQNRAKGDEPWFHSFTSTASRTRCRTTSRAA